MARVGVERPRVAALIPAAGTGERLGRGPKAFVEVGGRTLLERAVGSFVGRVDEVVVAVSPDMCGEAERLVGRAARVVLGGETRQESVYRLLETTHAEAVLVHDAARPFLPPEVIGAVREAVARSGAASIVMPVADTLVRAETGETIDRTPLRAVQTPQGFRREWLLEAHRYAQERGVQVTDDAALVRALGRGVALVEGSAWLMKVTTPADLEMAEALARVWDERGRDAR